MLRIEQNKDSAEYERGASLKGKGVQQWRGQSDVKLNGKNTIGVSTDPARINR